MIEALGFALLVALLATVVQTMRHRGEKSERIAAEDTARRLADAFKASETARRSDVARLNLALAASLRDAAKADAELRSVRDPAVLRDRLLSPIDPGAAPAPVDGLRVGHTPDPLGHPAPAAGKPRVR